MNEYYQDQSVSYPQYNYSKDEEIKNIVSQINPKNIIDDLNHALKGEYYNKDLQEWVVNSSGKPLVNDSCRGFVISYLDGILTNNTTMGNIDEKRLSLLMESIIETINKNFVCRLEEFGFVDKGVTYNKNIYENKGTPDTARMTMVANMVYKVCFLVLSRAVRGQESIRIFKSLSMVDNLSGGGMGGGQQKKGWMSKLFG